MALIGLAGQRFSQAPQPIHLSSFTVGIIRDLGSSGFLRTILMAPAGQWRAVAGAVAAFYLICIHQAQTQVDYSVF